MTDGSALNPQSMQKMITGLQALAVSGVIGSRAQGAAYKVLALDPLLKSVTDKTALEHVFGFLNKDDGHNTLASVADALKGRKDAVLEALPEEHKDFVSRLGNKLNEVFGFSKDRLAGVVEGHEGLRTAANVLRAAAVGKAESVIVPPTAANDEVPRKDDGKQVG